MAPATWWRGDALPPLAPVLGFHVEVPRDIRLLAHVTGLDPERVRQRLAGCHQPLEAPARAQAGPVLLGIPLIDRVPVPCWCCGQATPAPLIAGNTTACRPPLRPAAIPCTCAIALKPAKPNLRDRRRLCAC